MPYADSDFFVALLKKDDWLSKNALSLLKKYAGEIWTSQWTVVEILLIAKEYALDPETIVLSISQLARVEGSLQLLLLAAHYMKEYGFATFDALHAASCFNDKIISSDAVYDRIGMERIKLN